jgi:hypothetical protein
MAYAKNYGALRKPGNTYFLARSNIIGGTCLTTVFGMGTGMAKCLWSPGMSVVFDSERTLEYSTRETSHSIHRKGDLKEGKRFAVMSIS